MPKPECPFDDALDGASNAYKRYHIIPWTELAALSDGIRKDKVKLKDFFLKYDKEWLGKANLGEWDDAKTSPSRLDDFIKAISASNVEAVDTFEQLLAYAPGNLVVGPADRANDSVGVFDELACEIRACKDQNYTNLKKNWESDQSFEARFKILNKLICRKVLKEARDDERWTK